MSQEKSRQQRRRSSIETEEERAWVGFYQRVGRDVAIATEVIAQLESDPEMKRTHLALYLRCKESLRQQKASQARHKRIGQFVRWLCHGMFVRPMQSLHQGLRQGGHIAVECLPEVVKEPALVQVRRLGKDDEFATAIAEFAQHIAQPERIAGAPSEPSGKPDTKPSRVAA